MPLASDTIYLVKCLFVKKSGTTAAALLFWLRLTKTHTHTHMWVLDVGCDPKEQPRSHDDTPLGIIGAFSFHDLSLQSMQIP